MSEKIRKVRPDKSLLEKALLKANSEGLDLNMRQLIKYLIAQVNAGVVNLVIDRAVFDYGDYTTFAFEDKQMDKLRETIRGMKFVPTNDFAVNLLFFSYINQ